MDEDSIKAIRQLLIQCVWISGVTEESWTEENVKSLDNFILDTAIPSVVFYVHTSRGLQVDFTAPSMRDVVGQLCFMIRKPGAIITEERFEEAIQIHTLKGDPLKSLLQEMTCLHAPAVALSDFNDKNTKDQYTKEMHCFNIFLTEEVYKQEGKTILYVPMEAQLFSPEQARKDKNFIIRMEMMVIHWTDQIKELLNDTQLLDLRDSCGPLQEIEFWKSRTTKLSKVKDQLNNPEIQHIQKILQHTKSLYVERFCELSVKIKNCTEGAQSNLEYLSILKEPCEELSQLSPRQVTSKLKHIISLIRVIWNNAPYYDSERITGLFCQVNNEIIRVCSQSISLDKIFENNLSSKEVLDDCIYCCLSWKKIYLYLKEAHLKFSDKDWELDETRFFLVTDAFIQRLRTLLEVCDYQHQFLEVCQQKEMGFFRGHKGPESARMLQNIQAKFLVALQNLRKFVDCVFDLKDSRWNNEFHSFCTVVEDLERMMENLINSAFMTVNTVQEGIMLLYFFQPMTMHENIKLSIEEKSEEVYDIFKKDLKMVNAKLNQEKSSYPNHVSKLVGQAMKAKGFKDDLDKSMKFLQLASFMPRSHSYYQLLITYNQLVHEVDEIVRKNFFEWVQKLDTWFFKRVEQPLLIRTKETPSRLDVSMDNNLMTLFSDVRFWEQQKYETPQKVYEILKSWEDISILRDDVLLLARNCNRIIEMLSPDELGLFRHRLHFIDKKIEPGLSKLLFINKGTSKLFVNDCLSHVEKLQSVVDSFKVSIQSISNNCQLIGETLLVNIDGVSLYRDLEFEDNQKAYQQSHLQKLRSAHQNIISVMTQIHDTFAKDGAEVQKNSVSYVEKVDCLVEKAFQCNIRDSMKKLSIAINGRHKLPPSPLFKVRVVLRQSSPQTPSKVEFSPSLSKLAEIVNILPQLINVISEFKRLPELLFDTESQVNPVFINIEQDEKIRKTQAAINAGMTTNASNLQAYVKTWDKYRAIWEVNKDNFIQRYKRLNPPVSSFDADIQRYLEKANSVQQEEEILNIQFVTLDFSSLKSSLVVHCKEWQTKFTDLLCEMAIARLQELCITIEDGTNRLQETPQTLADLDNSLKLHETLMGNLDKTESQISVAHEHFALLDKYEVSLENSVQKMRDKLNDKWVLLNQVLADSKVKLQKQKETFRNSCLQSHEQFNKKVETTVKEFNSKGPFSSEISNDLALNQIAEHLIQLETLKQEQDTILNELVFFSIKQPPSKKIQILEKDIDQLQKVWEMTKEWNDNWNSWKVIQFSKLQLDRMENAAQDMFQKLNVLQQDLKDKDWEIVDFCKSKIHHFKQTIPLIRDLRNPAMRDRHWSQICMELLCLFDHTSADFTLEKILSLSLDLYTDKISEISRAASNELPLEQGLESISNTWKEIFLDIQPYKKDGHFLLRNTELIHQTFDDNQVTFSTLKTSQFIKPFEQELNQWQQQLSHMLEVVEMILTVQRHWVCLENIFQEKVILHDCEEFAGVSASWKTIMSRLHEKNNALQGTQQPGLLENLSQMNTKLEKSRKSLDGYLQTKCQIFPRFYFMSNDDILEALGQPQNPQAMQPHMKKCFSNINSLQLEKKGKKKIAVGMFSADGENVEFNNPVELDKPVEVWLCDIERAMSSTLKITLNKCISDLKKPTGQRDTWIQGWPGQIIIIASQIKWTSDVTQSLEKRKESFDRSSLLLLKKKQVSVLHSYSKMICEDLPKVLHLKTAALITVEVHARDVTDKLLRADCFDVNAFEWLCQLRHYLEKDMSEVNQCCIQQMNTQFKYGYEYLGNSGRLVITPLTDRCYMTLTTALHLHQGCSLKGPSATGKTETVKDLGKTLGMFVIAFSCSEGLDHKSLGRIFCGLAQTGAWGCFDDFNRINTEVWSMVGQQTLSILSALSAGQSDFFFEGNKIRLNPACGIFVTMNPGYAGHTELPDNLKFQFRPVSMVVPDSTLIAKVLLFAAGFNNCKLLAKKVFTLYTLAAQLLSKQDHYDFGLHTLTSMLRYAGNKRHSSPGFPDEDILVMAIKDMTVPKLTSADLTLFSGLIQDLFHPVKTPIMDYSKLKEAIELELQQRGLQVTPFTVTKIIQLYETKNSQHSSMLVGKTGSAKTVTWRTLQNALTALQQKEEPGFQRVQVYPLSPKSLSLGELYGEKDLSSNEWTDGVLSSLMRSVCADEKSDEKWIVFDGPVDTLWIESMNSVMDDNKVLTLVNGERILVPEQVSFLFEVENLAMASPATVSRCGVVYNNYADLGWRPFVNSWLEKRHKAEVEHLKILFDKYVESTLNFKRTNCRELIPTAELNSIISLCHLYESLATPTSESDTSETKTLGKVVELWFIFSLIWSICASVDEDGRRKMNNFLREINRTFPSEGTIYEYYVNPKKETWDSFEDQLPYAWRYSPTTPFYEIVVPTLDTVQYNFLIKTLVLNQYPVLLTGLVGTGKTVVAQSVLQGLDNKWTSLTINMSSQITCNNIQAIMKSRTEQKNKVVFMPANGKQMLCFLDDLNMPAHDLYGSQPPLEMLRFWIDYGFWYIRQKPNQQFVKNMSLMASMGPPGGGRTQISARLQSRFSLINMTFPEESKIKSIFDSIINQKLQLFKEEVKPVGDTVTQATLELFNIVAATFLPTPAKAHYLFSLRDISKVFQGLLRAGPDIQETQDDFARLWLHECYRVFSDRLVNQDDLNMFTELMKNKLASHFSSSFNYIWPNKQSLIFGDFLNNFSGYEDIQDMNVLKEFLKAQLGDFNSTAGNVPMNLVFFQDAIKHLTRILRVIRQPRGHMLLIGIEGSGRQSLSKMAAFICGYQVFQVEVTKRYHRQAFRTDIKNLYHLTGVENKPTVLLLNDSQIVDESFLEDINSILSSGEVPDLYKQNELTEVCRALSELGWKDDTMETPESLFSYLMERVRNNLHIVLCMSSVGEPFRKCLLQYPAIINSTAMDWFHEWPKDALLEVAERYLDGLELGSSDNIHRKSASFFETTHQSVKVVSQRMKIEMKRNNYVTPTNYLELLSGYRKMLVEKRSALAEQVNKLNNGLFKISDTQEKVEAMSVELKEVKKQIVEFQEEYDQFFVVFLQQKKEFSVQQKMVGVYREKTQEEKLQCKEIADNAQKELDMAMPALDEALMALESLNKKDLIEIRTYSHPPALVEMVLKAVMILLDKEPSWEEAKKQLGEANFIKSLINFEKNNISERVLKKVAQYCTRSDFLPETIGKVSLAAKSLCMWVKAMEVYGRIYKAIEPKRAQLNVAQSQLAEKQAAQAEAENKLQELTEKQSHLQKELGDKVAVKNSLKKKSEEMKEKLGQAERLFSDLAEERVHWTERVAGLNKAMECLVGDCLLTASFLSYMGPFLSNYREELLLIWKQKVVDLEIQITPGFSFTDFLSKPTVLRDWIIQGLPSDVFSTENGVIITHGNRWPLIVDPQGQAQRWIQNMENDKGLKLIDYRMPDYLPVLEDAVQFGSPVLLHSVQEELDLSLNPVLNKSLTQIGDKLLLKLGDEEVEYNPEFRLYITTKMSNPHYTPEIFSKTTIVNFAVNEQGLEAKLLGVVARSEQPDLEQQRDNLMFSVSADTEQLQELEDQILKCLLKKTSGSLLDDMELINTLRTNREVTEQLERSQQTMMEIDSTREAYHQCAQRATILFSVMNSMNLIDPMYQFSLDAYISLFTLSVEKGKHKPTLEERMSDLNDYHTYAVYSYMCRALFEAHKLIFSFQMCTKILEVAGKLDMNEYSFFVQGGNINKHDQRHNPCASWLPDSCWDNIMELKTLLKFKDIQTSFQQNPQDWNSWLTNSEPEKAPLPGDWDLTCNDLQKMLIVRSLRQDRVSFCISAFIVKHLGPRFVEPPALNMTAVVEESSSWTPLIFILSPGVDPMGTLLQLAEDSGMSKDLYALDLGQGNTPITKSLIEERMKNGHWLFLANCHLSPSWMPELDKLIMQLQKHKPHPNFRLWLSLSPHPEFPITILQAGIKMAIEPPKGVKANMKHLYQLVNETQFSRCSKPALYKKLLLSLCFFHSILLERKKFQQLGWNIIYSFNDSDFEVTENLICLDLDTFKTTPWDLIVEVIYGGHVTNEWDQCLLTTYIKEYFCEAAINPPSFSLSTLPIYNVPLNGPLSAYKDYIDTLPPTEQPEVFGLHPNADILSHTAETRTLFHTLLSLQPKITSWARASSEDTALKLLGNTRRKIPAPIDSCKIRTFIQENPSPLNMVLLQEILSYNSLLESISSSLVELEKGIKGLVVMSPSMEETLNCIYDARVPPLWEKAYPSLKPLAAWIQDLCQRVAQFSQWAETTKPPVLFWLSGFIFPNSFLTAVLQSTARQSDVTIDTLSWEFIVSTKDDISLVIPPKDGVYVRGLYLEGAGWDSSNSCLVEAEAMQMVFPIPTINFKPVEKHKKKSRNVYLCPCYYYPARAGRARQDSFVVGVELKSGDVSPEHWIKRGTALLMSLDT